MTASSRTEPHIDSATHIETWPRDGRETDRESRRAELLGAACRTRQTQINAHAA